MSIYTLSNPTFISTTKAGRLNSYGTVSVYLSGTNFNTFAAIWSDEQKTTQLVNPVTLDGSGTAQIWYEDKVDVVEKTNSGALIRNVLNIELPSSGGGGGTSGFNLVANGSFETDTTGQPDNWTIAPYSGSAIAITTATSADGLQSLEFNTTSVVTGGGVATSDKFSVTSGASIAFSWLFFSTNINTLNTFQVRWYDSGAGVISTSTLTMPAPGSAPITWTAFNEIIIAPSSAVQAEVIITGISSGGSNLSEKSYFDGITSTKETITPFSGGTIILDAEVPTTSGTSVVISESIPSWAKKINIMLNGVKSNGPAGYALEIGDSGGFEVAGYFSACSQLSNTVATGGSTNSGFLIVQNTNAAAYKNGLVVLSLQNSANNTWCSSGNIITETFENTTYSSGGSKSLSGTLVRIQLTTSTKVDIFDAGSVSISYEG